MLQNSGTIFLVLITLLLLIVALIAVETHKLICKAPHSFKCWATIHRHQLPKVLVHKSGMTLIITFNIHLTMCVCCRFLPEINELKNDVIKPHKKGSRMKLCTHQPCIHIREVADGARHTFQVMSASFGISHEISCHD